MNLKIKKSLLAFLSVFLGLFFPAYFVRAGWVLDLITGIATTPFFWVFWAVAQIAKYLTELMGSMLNWVLGPNFIRWDYTNPANNEVIKVGLGVTQGFANMLLVLVLVYIAIATILRLKDYEAQKLLPTFIIVALLVNFAPVICGLIVDAANIIMNFFVQDLKADVISKTMGAKITEIYSFSWSEGAQQSISRLFQLIIFSGILFTLSFILFIFILIFILRYLVIWLLVILSPLAFVAYILPATRKYFEQWWKQFLAWTFIGVTCGFFLYLSILMLNRVSVSITAPTTGQGGLLDAILPYFVAVIFLGIGVVFGLQTSAMGASGIIDFAKTKGKATVRGAGRKGWQLTKTGVEKARAKMPEGTRKWAERWKAERKWGEGEKGVGGFVKRTMATAVPIRYAMRGLGRVVAGKSIQTQQDEIKQYEKEMENKRTPELLADYHQAISDTRRIAALNTFVKKGEIDNIQDEKKHGGAAIKEGELKRIMKKAKKLESDRTIKTSLPYIAEEFVTDEEFTKAKEKDPRITSKLGVIISKMKPEDYGNISEKALDLKTKKGVEVVDNMLLMAMGSHISQFIGQYGRVGANLIKERITTQRGGEQGRGDIMINEKLEKYIRSSAGQAVIGIELPDKPTRAEPDEKDNKGNIIKRGKAFKPGYLRQEDKLVYIDSEAKMNIAPTPSSTGKTPSKKPIKGPTIGQEIKKRKKE